MGDRSASMLELKALRVPTGHYDVAVLGGGLAGLSMALQLKRDRPETRVLVTDKRTEPAPEAAFKVGESTVEIGAHYYREVVGMRDHLEQAQLRKLGLRFYLPAGDNSDITKRVEFCTPAHLAPSPTRSTAGASRTSSSGAASSTAPTPSAAGASRTSSSDPTQHTSAQPGGRGAQRHGALDRRRERPREHPAQQARPRHRHRPPHQRGLVPARRRPRLRGVGRRRGVARPDARARPAPALDHPPDRRGLLALADPARLGPDQHRRLRRPALPPVGGDRELRRAS